MNKEILLYRFDLKVGDTVPRIANSIVTDIDSVEINSKHYIKRYNYSTNSFTSFLLQGVGSDAGLFNFRGFQNPYILVAYNSSLFEHTGTFWEELPYESCFPTSITNVSTKKPFNIYPNPITDNTLHITSPGIEKLSIIDIAGRTVYTSSQLDPGEQTINIDLPAGIYILKAQLSDGTTQVRKIVRQ